MNMSFCSHNGWQATGRGHIGMTPWGSYISGKRRPKPAPKRTGPFVDHSKHDLRQACFAGDQDAIAEWTHRNETGGF